MGTYGLIDSIYAEIWDCEVRNKPYTPFWYFSLKKVNTEDVISYFIASGYFISIHKHGLLYKVYISEGWEFGQQRNLYGFLFLLLSTFKRIYNYFGIKEMK